MKSSLITRKAQETDRLSWLGGALIGVMAVVGGIIVAYSLIMGPELRAQMDERDMAERQQEDVAFCGKFGMAPATEAYAACANELVHVRRLETARVNRRIQPY